MDVTIASRVLNVRKNEALVSALRNNDWHREVAEVSLCDELAEVLFNYVGKFV